LGSSVTVTNKAPVLPLEDINVESLINDIVMASSNTAEATSSSTESLQVKLHLGAVIAEKLR